MDRMYSKKQAFQTESCFLKYATEPTFILLRTKLNNFKILCTSNVMEKIDKSLKAA